MAIIIGTEGDEQGATAIIGTSVDDRLEGLGGNDLLRGLGGSDTLIGGTGNDTLETGTSDGGIERVDPGTGFDRIDLTNLITFLEVIYFDAPTTLTVTLNERDNIGRVIEGGATTDTFVDFGRVARDHGVFFGGSRNADRFDVLSGDRDSYIHVDPDAGNDTINLLGGEGTVRLGFYGDGSQGVVVDLAAGTVDAGSHGMDRIIGSVRTLQIQTGETDDYVTGANGEQEQYVFRGGNDTIFGAGGVDRLRVDQDGTSNVVVDLAQGRATGRWEGTPFTLTLGGIEEVSGARDTGDVLRGDGADNFLDGNGGNDTLEGRDGRDRLQGEDGNDILVGGNGRDTLLGGDGNDLLDGSQGDANDQGSGDLLRGGFGNDTLLGHQGHFAQGREGALVSYADIAGIGGIEITVTDGATGRGTVVSRVGSSINDVFEFSRFFQGSADADIIRGGQSSQTGFAGLGGDDTLIGGSNAFDFLQYNDDRFEPGGGGAVTVNFETGQATDGFGSTDTFSGMEQVRGSERGDTFIGSANGERMIGAGGSDTADGRGGDDTLLGESGNDTLRGGDGRDRLEGGDGNDLLDASGGAAATQGFGDYIRPGLGADEIRGHAGHWATGEGADISYADLSGIGGVVITSGTDGTGTVTSGQAGQVNDTFTYIHYFEGTQDGDIIRGSAEDRFEGFSGLGGADTIRGGEGGFDRVDYSYEDGYFDGNGSGINADLARGTVVDTQGFTDVVSGMEALDGSRFDDRIAGANTGERLRGNAGDDVIGGDGILAAQYGSGLANTVYRLYQATLDRAPDLGGHAAWAGRLYTGERTLLEVAEGFVGSPEFTATYSAGLSNEAFVTLLYNNVLDSQPDARGLARWTGDLEAGASRAEVVLGFSESPQFSAETAAAANTYARQSAASDWSDDVFRLYQATLDRAPDMMGQTNWSMRVATGERTLTEVAEGFVGSPEFAAAYAAGLSNEDFVRLLYRNVLNTDTPDDQGLARWTGELAAGASRAEVVLGFSQSPQFTTETAAPLKAWMRDQGVQDEIDGGAGTNLLAGGQFMDVFVFDADTPQSSTVADLEAWDIIDLQTFEYADANAARAQMTQTGADLVFADSGVQVTFRDTTLAEITDDMIVL